MDKKLKVGIIGCGGIANGKHMPALSKVEGVEMVAFCDIVKLTALDFCSLFFSFKLAFSFK